MPVNKRVSASKDEKWCNFRFLTDANGRAIYECAACLDIRDGRMAMEAKVRRCGLTKANITIEELDAKYGAGVL